MAKPEDEEDRDDTSNDVHEHDHQPRNQQPLAVHGYSSLKIHTLPAIPFRAKSSIIHADNEGQSSRLSARFAFLQPRIKKFTL